MDFYFEFFASDADSPNESSELAGCSFDEAALSRFCDSLVTFLKSYAESDSSGSGPSDHFQF